MLTANRILYSAPIPGLSVPQMMQEYQTDNKEEAIREYFAHYIRYYSTSWNIPETWVDQNGNAVASTFSANLRPRSPYPFDQILENYAVYLGEQMNTNYAFLTQTVTGESISTPMRPSQKGFQIINFLVGTYARAMRNAKPHCAPISRQSLTRKELRMQVAEVASALRDSLQELSADGLTIGEEEVLGADQEEKVADILARSPKDKMEVLGNELLGIIAHENLLTESAIASFQGMEIAKYAGFHCRIEAGRPIMDRLMPYQIIFDPSYDDDYNSKGRYRGVIEWLTPEEIAQREYEGFNKDMFTDLVRYRNGTDAEGSPLDPFFQNTQGINFTWSNKRRDKFTVVTMYWIGYRDLGLKLNEDRTMAYEYRYTRKEETSGDYFKPVIFQGTLIANRFIVNFGEASHIPYQPGGNLESMIPITVCLPNITRGRVKSPIDRVKDYISQLEAYNYKVAQKAMKAHGRVPVLNAAAFKSKRASGVLADIVKQGFVIANFSGGEWIDPTTNKKIVEVMDFTMDSDIKAMVELADVEERRIDAVFNTTPIVTGTQRTYVGTGTQQDSISQATLGTANDIERHATFMAKTMQVMVNMLKAYYATPEGLKYAEQKVSLPSLRFLKETKNLTAETLGIYITVLDNLEPAERQQIMTMAQTLLPSGVNPKVLELLVDLVKTPTATEMSAKISAISRQMERDAQRAEAEKAKEQAMLTQLQGQPTIEKAQIEDSGKTQREALKEDGLDRRAVFDASVQEPAAQKQV